MKILVLCHGNRHRFASCNTCSVPITGKSVKSMTMVDLKENVSPDLVLDWKTPIDRKMYGKYDAVTMMCCDGSVFIDYKTLGFHDVSFDNVIKALKRGGYFVMEPLPIATLKAVAKHVLDMISKHPEILEEENVIEPSYNIKRNLQILKEVVKNPFEVEDHPTTESFLNKYMAFSITTTYPRLEWIKDPRTYVEKIYEELSEPALIKGALDEFKNKHFLVFQKKSVLT